MNYLKKIFIDHVCLFIDFIFYFHLNHLTALPVLLFVLDRRRASSVNNFTMLTSFSKLQSQLLPFQSISKMRKNYIIKRMTLPTWGLMDMAKYSK